MLRSVLPVALAASLAGAEAGTGQLIPIPFVFSYPETSWGGGMKLRWQDPLSRPGYADLTVLGSMRHQADLDGTWQRDSIGGVWRAKLFAQCGKFPEKWFGSGDPPSDSLEGIYTPHYQGGFVEIARLLPLGYSAGLRLRMQRTEITNDGQGIFARVPTWTGPRGGTDLDLTWTFERERRDFRENPREGSFASAQFMTSLPGGSFRWRDAVVDLSDAESMGSFTAVTRIHHEEAWGDVPFWQVPALGWRKSMRGLPDKRLRGRAVQCVGMEGRWNGPSLWIFPMQPAVFGELGRAGDHDDLWSADFRWAAGGGLRVPLAGGKAVLRADYGWSAFGSGLYIDFGQAF